jgi:hypothetical protein
MLVWGFSFLTIGLTPLPTAHTEKLPHRRHKKSSQKWAFAAVADNWITNFQCFRDSRQVTQYSGIESNDHWS